MSPLQLTAPHIAALIMTWKSQHNTSTVHSYRAFLHNFLEFVDEASGTKLARHVPHVPTPLARTVVWQTADFLTVLNASPTWFRCFLLMCRYIGLRHQEAQNITPRHWNPETNTITLDRKAGSHSELPLPLELATMFKFAAEQNPDAPILATLGSRTHNERYLTKKLAAIKTKAGVKNDATIHDLRRTCARELYDNTHDLRLVQQLLGHRNLSSTLAYVGMTTPEDLRAALAAIPRPDLYPTIPLATEITQ
jgi:integrase